MNCFFMPLYVLGMPLRVIAERSIISLGLYHSSWKGCFVVTEMSPTKWCKVTHFVFPVFFSLLFFSFCKDYTARTLS